MFATHSSTLRLRASLWLFCICIVAAALIVRWREGFTFDSDFLTMLPVSDRDELENAAVQQLARAADGRIVWIVGSTSQAEAARSATRLAAMLTGSGLFSRIDGIVLDSIVLDGAVVDRGNEPAQARWAELFPLRWQLLDPEIVDQLRRSPVELAQRTLQQLYGPLAAARLAQLTTDPFGLFERYAATLAPEGFELYRGQVAMTTHDDKHWAVISTTLRTRGLDLVALEALSKFVTRTRFSLDDAQVDTDAQADTNVELLVTGLPLFTAEGANRAKSEISVVGAGSTVAILVLLLFTFRSIRPVVLAFIASATGVLFAITVCGWVFPGVHLLTLVFGSTLIGLSIDYALHFLCDSLHGPGWTAEVGIQRTFLGIGLGLAVPLTAYMSLSIAPFPLLRQIAVFSAAGLTGAWLTAVLLLPAFVTAPEFVRTPAAMRLAIWYSTRFPKLEDRTVAIGVAACVVLFAALIHFIRPADDVHTFQSPSAALRAESERIQSVLRQQRDTQLILVRGTSAQQVLVHERRAAAVLEHLVSDGKLRGYSALSNTYPTEAQQRENYRLVEQTLYDSPVMEDFWSAIHATPETRTTHRLEFAAARDRTVTLDQWTNTVGEPFSDLWLGCTPSSGCASIITLSGFAELGPADLARLGAIRGVSVVDRVGDISSQMAHYRVVATRLTIGAYLVAAVLLSTRFGPAGALRITAVPFAAVVFTLITLEASGASISLFTTFALVLVVGFAFDYAVFYRLHGTRSPTTSLAVLLSAATTLLAFGLLALSSTAVVGEFGSVMTLGMLSAYLFAPVSGGETPDDRS